MNPYLIEIQERGNKKHYCSRRQSKESFKWWVNSTYILALFFAWLLGIYYVWTLNRNAINWYNLRTLEIENNNLTIEKEQLELATSDLESLGMLMSWEWVEKMNPVEQFEYLVLKNSTEWFAYNDDN